MSLSKKYFYQAVGRGNPSPTNATPLELLAIPVAKTAMKRFFFEKSAPVVAVHAADNDFYGYEYMFFDSLIILIISASFSGRTKLRLRDWTNKKIGVLTTDCAPCYNNGRKG